MNKATKGAMAAGAAALLLLGGAGSLALWSDSESVDGGAINTGTLDISSAAGTWQDVSVPGVPVDISDISLFRMVPGDTVEYTTEMTVTVIGNNLSADVEFDPTFVPVFTEGPDAGILAARNITRVAPTAANFTVDVDAFREGTTTPVTTITDADDNLVIDVTVSIAFDAIDQVGINTTASFEDFDVTVQQVRP